MERLANSPLTSLNGAIGDSVTAITVVSAGAFPPTGDFTVNVAGELMKVTGVSGNVFTVARGQEGTTATGHANGEVVKQVITMDVMNRLMAEFNKTGPWNSRPALVRAGTVYQATDMDVAWLFNGTEWDLVHPLYVPYAKRVNVSGWTALNLGTNVWMDHYGVACVAQSSGPGIKGYYKALPTPPYTVTMIIGPSMHTVAEHRDGIILYDSGSTKVKSWTRSSGGGDYRMKLQTWNNPTSFLGTTDDSRMVGQIGYFYLRLEDDNTNWKYWVSHNNQDWHLIRTETRNTFLTPTHIGMASTRDTPSAGSFTWYSRYFGYWE